MSEKFDVKDLETEIMTAKFEKLAILERRTCEDVCLMFNGKYPNT